MYFPRFQKRFKRQQELFSNHAQKQGMTRYKVAPNQTAKAIEVDSASGTGGNLCSVDASGNIVSASNITAANTLTGTVAVTTGLVTCDNLKNTVTVYSGSGSSIGMGACTGLMTITNTSAQAFTTTSPGSVPANTIFALKNISAFTQTFTASSSSLDGVGSGTKAILTMTIFYFYTDGSNWFSA